MSSDLSRVHAVLRLPSAPDGDVRVAPGEPVGTPTASALLAIDLGFGSARPAALQALLPAGGVSLIRIGGAPQEGEQVVSSPRVGELLAALDDFAHVPTGTPEAERLRQGYRQLFVTLATVAVQEGQSRPRLKGIDPRLRSEVRLLGAAWGAFLRDAAGEEAFQLVESLRQAAVAGRNAEPGAHEAMLRSILQRVAGLEGEALRVVIRGFGKYLSFVNLAEQEHRIRRCEEYAMTVDGPPQADSIDAALLQLASQGVSAAEARELIRRLGIELVCTNHPNQSVHRQTRDQLRDVAAVLRRQTHTKSGGTVAEQRFLADMSALMQQGWSSDELRRSAPRPHQEVANTIPLMEELYALAPVLSRQLSEAFAKAYGEPLGFRPTPLRVKFWAGGDGDGNPSVNWQTTQASARDSMLAGTKLLSQTLESIQQKLTLSERQVTVPDVLRKSLAADVARAATDVAVRAHDFLGQPWAQKVAMILGRLKDSRRTLLDGGQRPEFGCPYDNARELRADVALLRDTLPKNEVKARAALEDLLVQIDAFGFTLGSLELRYPAHEVRETAALLASGRTPEGQSARYFDAMGAMYEAQQAGGSDVCNTSIVSMASGVQDFHAALDVAKAQLLYPEGGPPSVNIVLLFENEAAHDNIKTIARSLFPDPRVREYAQAQGSIEFFVGYSDLMLRYGLAGRDGAVAHIIQTLRDEAAKANFPVPLHIFHGWGPTPERGGGLLQNAIAATPTGSLDGFAKMLVQGEDVWHKFGEPTLALRTLNQIGSAVLLHSANLRDTSQDATHREVYETFTRASAAEFHALVWEDPEYERLVYAVEPVEAVGDLQLTSRPQKRGAGGMAMLRAINAVYAGNATRRRVLGIHGAGTGLAAAIEKHGLDAVRAAAQAYPPMRVTLERVSRVLLMSSDDVARLHEELLAPPEMALLSARIAEERARAEGLVPLVLGEGTLAENRPVLRESVALRNPYVDVLSMCLLEAMRRERKAKEAGEDTAEARELVKLGLVYLAEGQRATG